MRRSRARSPSAASTTSSRSGSTTSMKSCGWMTQRRVATVRCSTCSTAPPLASSPWAATNCRSYGASRKPITPPGVSVGCPAHSCRCPAATTIRRSRSWRGRVACWPRRSPRLRSKIISSPVKKFSFARGCPAPRRPITPYPRHCDEGPRAVDWPAILGWPAFFWRSARTAAEQRSQGPARQLHEARRQLEERAVLPAEPEIVQLEVDRGRLACAGLGDAAVEPHQHPVSAYPRETSGMHAVGGGMVDAIFGGAHAVDGLAAYWRAQQGLGAELCHELREGELDIAAEPRQHQPAAHRRPVEDHHFGDALDLLLVTVATGDMEHRTGVAAAVDGDRAVGAVGASGITEQGRPRHGRGQPGEDEKQ